MAKQNINAIYMMLGIVGILGLVIFMGKDAIVLQPDCSFQPDAENCRCYNDKLKVETSQGFICKVTQCTTATADMDCSSELHAGCVGQWSCVTGSCAWTCTK
jgi:hypothetical protein